MSYFFLNTIKSVKLLSLTSNDVDEQTTGQYHQGVHRSMVITDSSGQKWLVKLSTAEHISTWRQVPPNRCYVREVGAFVVSDAMKLGLVPETKLINYDGNIGSAQKWVDAKPFETMDIFSERDIYLAGVFDLIIGQLDRHRGNILVDNQNLPRLIDNGYCLSGDTKIKLLDGTFATMEELSKRTDNYWVYGMDEVGKIIPSLATPAKVTGENIPVYEVILDNGESVKATTEHLFLMQDSTYHSLRELVVGDSLMPLYWKNSRKGLCNYELILQPKVLDNRKCWHYTHKLVVDKIKRGYVVHHKDYNKRNNCPDNLLIMTINEHREEHTKYKLGKTNIEIFGVVKAQQIKDKKKRARIGKTWEEIYGAERAKIMKDKKALQMRGKTWEEFFGKKATVERKVHLSIAGRGKTWDKIYGTVRAEQLRQERSNKNKDFINRFGVEKAAEIANKISVAKIGHTWEDVYGVEKANIMKKNQSLRMLGNTRSVKKNNHKIVAINFVGVVDKVYDITTTTHNFGLAAGIFVHNSMPWTVADKSKNIIISRFAYEIWDKPLPPWLLQMLEVTPWDKVKRELYDERLFGKNAAAIDLFFQRLAFILKAKKASIPDFMVTRRILRS